MPHAGLMDEKALGPVAGPLQRARLHIRSGKRRLRQGKVSAGIVTLYDAVLAAMDWYTAEPARRTALGDSGNLPADEKAVYRVLVGSGILDGKFDFNEFDKLTERALQTELDGYDCGSLVSGIESVMHQLGVMPFDEGALPPEDPRTY